MAEDETTPPVGAGFRLRLRGAVRSDAERLARLAIEGVADYPAFAPPGWAPPLLDDEIRHVWVLLGAGYAWCLVAEEGDELVGQVTVVPARRAPRPTRDPRLAHVSNLFVRRDHWGTGLARTLLDAAVAHARAEGYDAMRLFVAEGQARARRFYEREGWTATGAPFHDPTPGLRMLEYRRGSGPGIGHPR
jgi:GNAT superfamily N-acetyltransferase